MQLYDCNSTGAQIWSVGNSDHSIGALGRFLDVTAASGATGRKIQVYDRNGTAALKWAAGAGGTLINTGSGRRPDVLNNSAANGDRLRPGARGTGANQKWTLPGGPATAPPGSRVHLDTPAKKDVALRIVSAAEHSSLDWRAQFSSIEDIGGGRGYTAGIVGFCSGTGDMLELVEAYTAARPGNVLAKYLPVLCGVNGTPSHAGLGPDFTRDWRTAAADPVFQAAQESERDRVYFDPSVRDGKADGVRALGQFAYFDAAVLHGHGGMRSIRARAVRRARPPSQGGNETTWLNAFLDERVVEMRKEAAHQDVTRIDTAQRVFLRNGNLDLDTPLDFAVHGDAFRIA